MEYEDKIVDKDGMKRKKIGIVTIISQNYGNRLQNYALQKVLEDLGCEAETLQTNRENRKNKIKEYIKAILYPYIGEKNWGWAYFKRSCIHWSSYIHTDDELNQQYDFFIAGSDQIWNPYFYFISDREFLTFAPPEKRIAYAASIGVSELPDRDTEIKYTQYWNEFYAISVRENAGAAIIKECLGIDVPVVLDPTILLKSKRWNELALKSKIKPRKKYVVKYFLGKVNSKIDNEIDFFANEIGAFVIHIQQTEPFQGQFIGPIEFLYLIQNCEFVFADSFHAVAFSVIFHREFLALRRYAKEDTGDMNSRIETILQMLKLSDRFLEDEGMLKEIVSNKIDYGIVDRIVDKKREKSMSFLKKVLGF